MNLLAYPASEWTLKAMLRGPGVIDITGTPDGCIHVLTVPADTTKTWTPGTYFFSSRITNGSATFEVDSGQTVIQQDFASIIAPTDLRGHVQKVLDSIEAVIEGRASKDQERYRIQDRELWRTPIADLLKLRSYYRNELTRIKAAERGINPVLGRTIRTRL